MNYRTIFLEFLANYREYHYDCIQLILFENQHNDNILKVMSDANLVDVYQVKGAQVFNKKLTFSSVNNTILNLLFITENPEIIEISKSDDEIKKFQDLYSSKTLYDLNYKYLIIYPVYQNQQLLGGLFIFSNYQLIWQIEESKLNKFIDNLEQAKCLDIIDEINKKTNNPYWSLVNKGVYINTPLAEIIQTKEYHHAFNFKGYSLELLDTIDYLSGKVNVFQYVPKLPIFGSIEFDRLKMSNYTLVYSKVIDEFSYEELVNKISIIMDNIDGSLGYYKIYQTDLNSIAVIFEKTISKKGIDDFFKTIPYTLIRSGHEISKIIDFQVLREYLNLSPLEEFNSDYFEYYQQKLLLEKKANIQEVYTSSKIIITPFYNSLNMNVEGYLISDLYDLKNASIDIKLKSIKAISKIVKDYKNVVISITLDSMFNGQKPYLAYINILKRLCSDNELNVKILTNYNKKQILLLKTLWNDIEKYLYFKEEDSNFYELLMLDKLNALCLSKDSYADLIIHYPNKAFELTEFWMNKANKVFVFAKQNDIIKYRNEKILLILGD